MISTACTISQTAREMRRFSRFSSMKIMSFNNAAIVETDNDKASKTSKLIDDYL